MPKKNPFVNYTLEEIAASEATHYTIIAGQDFFELKGRFVFDKKTAIKYYNRLMMGIIHQIKYGNKKERAEARMVLEDIKVVPFRMH